MRVNPHVRTLMVAALLGMAVDAPTDQTQPPSLPGTPKTRIVDTRIPALDHHFKGSFRPGAGGGTVWGLGRASGTGAPPQSQGIHFVIPRNTCEQGEPLQELRGPPL